MNEKEDKISDVKKKLDSAKYSQKESWRHHLAPKQYSVSGDWEGEENEEVDDEPKLLTSMPKAPKTKMGILTVLFIVSVVFLISAISFALFSFRGGKVGISKESITIDVTAPISIASGELLKLDISVSNNNQVNLEVAELVIEYPSGTRQADDITESLSRTRTVLGEINTGEIVKHLEVARIFGEEDETVVIPIKLEYRIPSSNAVFEVYKDFDLTLSSSPLRLDVTGLDKVTGGQRVSFDVALESNGNEILRNVLVEAEYPFGFSFIDSNIEPIFNNRIWEFEEISPGETIDITIDGILEGENNEDRFFKFNAGLQDSEIREKINVLFTTFNHVISISNPFLALDLKFDDESGDVFINKNEETIAGEIIIENTTENAISNAKVVIDINENLFDKYTISSNEGFFDSTNSKITWNPQVLESLKVLAPGDSVFLDFVFTVDSFVRESGAVISKPEMTFDVLVSGNRINERGVDEEIKASTFKKIIFQSDVKFVGNSLYNTPEIINYGPIPPKVEEATAYAAYFEIFNPTSQITDAVVTATLPQYANWKNVISPTTENVKYNDITRIITWDIGNIPAGTGYITSPKRVAFQVEIFPSANQSGRVLSIIGQPKFVGYDTHTEINIEEYLESFTTDTEDIGKFDEISVIK
jgi:hypothetical protein